jgi:hypothetical protein
MVDVFDTLIADVKEAVNSIDDKVKSTLTKFDDKLKKITEHDSLIEKYCDEYKDIRVTLNVGGKIFRLSVPKLLSCKDSLFNKLFIDNKDDFINGEEFYIDRDPSNFSNIVEYLTLGYIAIPRNDPEGIIEELKFFNMTDPLKNPHKFEKNVIDYIEMELSQPYLVNDVPIANEDIDELKEDSKEAGICVRENGHIIFELEDTVKINRMDLRGCTVNDNIWSPSSGQKGNIFCSTNKINWNKISKVPKNYGRAIATLKFNPTTAKYVKFQHTGRLGLGYLRIYYED